MWSQVGYQWEVSIVLIFCACFYCFTFRWVCYKSIKHKWVVKYLVGKWVTMLRGCSFRMSNVRIFVTFLPLLASVRFLSPPPPVQKYFEIIPISFLIVFNSLLIFSLVFCKNYRVSNKCAFCCQTPNSPITKTELYFCEGYQKKYLLPYLMSWTI